MMVMTVSSDLALVPYAVDKALHQHDLVPPKLQIFRLYVQ